MKGVLGMRRFVFVALVLSLVMVLAVPAGARDVVNSSQTMVQMYGNWGSYDEGTGAYFDGGVYVTDYGRDTWIEYYESTGTPIVCEGDVPGWGYQSFWGSGTAVFTAAKSYTSGHAEGVVEGWFDIYTYCEGDEGMVQPENGGGGFPATFSVMVDFTGVSPLIREKSSGSFKIPGEYNSHDVYSSVYRYGDVTATVDGASFLGFGQLGKVSWKSHYNSK